MALNSSAKSVRCASRIILTSTSWISSGVRGPSNRCSRLARQLAINLKTQADTRVSLVQLDQLTGLSFQVGSLETGTALHCGCELKKVFLASVVASFPLQSSFAANRFQLSERIADHSTRDGFPLSCERLIHGNSSLRTGSWRSKRLANIRRQAPGNRSLHAFSQIANVCVQNLDAKR